MKVFTDMDTISAASATVACALVLWGLGAL